MAMDATDSKLIKGLLLFVILVGTAYYYPFEWPFEGYRSQLSKLDVTRQELSGIRKDYRRHYPPAPASVWGDTGLAEAPSPALSRRVGYLAERRSQYEREIALHRGRIRVAQDASRMSFGRWTDIPKEWRREPGVYFANCYQNLRISLDSECRKANVDLYDREIGFKKFTEGGGHLTMTRTDAQELLRELFITETVTRLCIKAKLEQEQVERKKGRKPEAFMRIIKVTPQYSVAAGPYAQIPNPHYDPNEKNPKSKKWRKYLTRKWPAFIREYPIEIQLQCDVNSFMRFLYKVRTRGQFLVIRNLEIVSPFMDKSAYDKSELERFLRGESEPHKPSADNHIWVRISAAGMDFFDPDRPSARSSSAGAPAGRRRRRSVHRDTVVKPAGH